MNPIRVINGVESGVVVVVVVVVVVNVYLPNAFNVI
jgi:hypothetical protein